MILIFHHKQVATAILDKDQKPIPEMELGKSMPKTLLDIQKGFPDVLVVWCAQVYKNELDLSALDTIFHHKRILASYNPSAEAYLPKQIGYIERSYHIKVKKDVSYPTWQMSPLVGGIHTSVLNVLANDLNYKTTFGYFLNSIGKRGMAEGLFCYSEPGFFKDILELKHEREQASKTELFRFVKQHYKWVWVFMLGLCYFIYEKKSSVFTCFRALFYRQLNDSFELEKIPIQSQNIMHLKKEVDVIIPTIGRAKYLYDVLKDLSQQTICPKQVIIVEQNPDPNGKSELDYLKTETWPFNIKQHFTHQTGVCNARNIALDLVESDWIFFADDDIRFEKELFEKSFDKIERLGASVLNYLCLQAHQKQSYFKTGQTTVFGSGSSMVKTEHTEGLRFDMAFEFGFGEDSDFGMQMRYRGTDVVYVPDIKILHLKAPIGGYRTVVKQLWDDETIPPKPSPSVALLYQRYFSETQIQGYKILLFLRHYKSQTIKNPFKYIAYSKKQWERSVYWSSVLKAQQHA